MNQRLATLKSDTELLYRNAKQIIHNMRQVYFRIGPPFQTIPPEIVEHLRGLVEQVAELSLQLSPKQALGQAIEIAVSSELDQLNLSPFGTFQSLLSFLATDRILKLPRAVINTPQDFARF